MNENPEIRSLLRRLDLLAIRHNVMQEEIEKIRFDLKKLAYELPIEPIVEPLKTETIELKPSLEPPINVENQLVTNKTNYKEMKISNDFQSPKPHKSPVASDLEKFIGENLSNKIGIVITVIGIAIGVKYAIDNDLISPLTRIILGYLMGIGLFGASVRLRAKYLDLSAVILSGALVTFYFITYVAYDFYALIPQALAFVMMVVVTVFTVISALSYDRQIIAVGGLVGAYAVPFLLSNNSDRPDILFSYMVIINVGILVIAFQKYWQILHYLAFGVTWLIFGSWYVSSFRINNFGLAFFFMTVFFGIFYAVFLAYKLKKDKGFDGGDVVLLLGNAAFFFGFGYSLLENNETGKHFLGLYTVLNAVIHFGVSMTVFRRQLTDKNLFFLVSGLVLVFITLAIPVQLEGHWVTIFWAGEMALVFWIGRTKGVSVYEKLSYPLIILTFFSLLNEWEKYALYDPSQPETRIFPIVNILFLTTLIVLAAYFFVRKVNNTEGVEPAFKYKGDIKKSINYGLISVMIFLIYALFFIEISTFFNQNYADSYRQIGSETYDYIHDEAIQTLKIVWLFNYTIAFVCVFLFLNLKKLNNLTVAKLSSLAAILILALFLLLGLYGLGELKNAYLDNIQGEYYFRSQLWVGLRYTSLALVAVMIYGLFQTIQTFFKGNKGYFKIFEVGFSGTLLWVISSETVHWLEIMRFDDIYKLAISVLFGVFASGLIAYGINKGKRHLRIAAIGLFGFTLLKLFLYDLAQMGTISKTIALISLGILLLIISFLYNKFKDTILGNDEEKVE